MPIEHRSIWQTRTPVMNRGVRQAGIEQTQSVASNECQKKCGSRSCKTAIKFTPNGASNPEEKKCPGVGTGCTSCRTKLANDMQEADRWLLTFDGNRAKPERYALPDVRRGFDHRGRICAALPQLAQCAGLSRI